MKTLKRILTGINERLAWFCTMLCLSAVALVSPAALQKMLSDYNMEEAELCKP